jgi:cell division protein ZapA
MKKELTIQLAGQTLTIRSDEDESYVADLAASVDSQIRDISRGQPGVSTLSLALMAALTMADEVHKLETSQDAAEQAMDALSNRIQAVLGRES